MPLHEAGIAHDNVANIFVAFFLAGHYAASRFRASGSCISNVRELMRRGLKDVVSVAIAVGVYSALLSIATSCMGIHQRNNIDSLESYGRMQLILLDAEACRVAKGRSWDTYAAVQSRMGH